MNRNETIARIINILKNRLKVDYSKTAGNNYELELTGDKIKLGATEIFYLFMEIERDFHVKIDCAQILNYEFNTLNSIANILEKQLA